jgi:uncharacterized repeat protein (TIGR03803 family)
LKGLIFSGGFCFNTSQTESPVLFMSKRYFLPFVSAACLVTANIQAQQTFFSPMHSFSNKPDAFIGGSIVMGVDNAIYGVSWRGGDTNLVHDGGGLGRLDGGAIFKINTDGSGYKVLHTFSGSETHNNSPSAIIPSGENGISIAAGRDGMIYGTTEYGTNGNGLVFRCNSDGNDFTILHNFNSLERLPLSLIHGRDGMLYGTSFTAIFTLDTQGGNYRVLHTFTNNPADEGLMALGHLLQTSDGALYGTTASDYSGITQAGNVFKLMTNGDFTVLHTFAAFVGDGKYSLAGLIQGSDGAIYGTTYYGGSANAGTVFKLNTNGSGYQILHNFAAGDPSSNDGAYPWGELTQGSDGALYGTTSFGVNNDSRGTIFKINTDGTGYNVVYNFPTAISNGSRPYCALLPGPSDGNTVLLYGTTTASGQFSGGTIFSLLVNPPTLAITPGTIQAPGGQVVLYWPAWAFNYTLQTTTNLQSSNWVTVSNAVPVSAAVVTNVPPSAFFRLIHQ